MTLQEFATKCQDICSFLGSEWKFELRSQKDWAVQSASIKLNDIEVRVRTDDYKLKGKMEFRGCYPLDKNGYQVHLDKEKDSMICSSSKTASQLGGDILKRILPNIIKNTSTVKDILNSNNQAEEKLAADVKLFKDLGCNRTPKNATGYVDHYTDKISFSVELNGRDSFFSKMTIHSCSKDTLIKIAELLIKEG